MVVCYNDLDDNEENVSKLSSSIGKVKPSCSSYGRASSAQQACCNTAQIRAECSQKLETELKRNNEKWKVVKESLEQRIYALEEELAKRPPEKYERQNLQINKEDEQGREPIQQSSVVECQELVVIHKLQEENEQLKQQLDIVKQLIKQVRCSKCQNNVHYEQERYKSSLETEQLQGIANKYVQTEAIDSQQNIAHQQYFQCRPQLQEQDSIQQNKSWPLNETQNLKNIEKVLEPIQFEVNENFIRYLEDGNALTALQMIKVQIQKLFLQHQKQVADFQNQVQTELEVNFSKYSQEFELGNPALLTDVATQFQIEDFDMKFVCKENSQNKNCQYFSKLGKQISDQVDEGNSQQKSQQFGEDNQNFSTNGQITEKQSKSSSVDLQKQQKCLPIVEENLVKVTQNESIQSSVQNSERFLEKMPHQNNQPPPLYDNEQIESGIDNIDMIENDQMKCNQTRQLQQVREQQNYEDDNGNEKENIVPQYAQYSKQQNVWHSQERSYRNKNNSSRSANNRNYNLDQIGNALKSISFKSADNSYNEHTSEINSGREQVYKSDCQESSLDEKGCKQHNQYRQSSPRKKGSSYKQGPASQNSSLPTKQQHHTTEQRQLDEKMNSCVQSQSPKCDKTSQLRKQCTLNVSKSRLCSESSLHGSTGGLRSLGQPENDYPLTMYSSLSRTDIRNHGQFTPQSKFNMDSVREECTEQNYNSGCYRGALQGSGFVRGAQQQEIGRTFHGEFYQLNSGRFGTPIKYRQYGIRVSWEKYLECISAAESESCFGGSMYRDDYQNLINSRYNTPVKTTTAIHKRDKL